jgi:hypothetical protein
MFGNGKACYVRKSDEIAQNVKTRVRSFQGDWFLDTSKNIDWWNILGQYNNSGTILAEISRVVLDTTGVVRIDSIEITDTTDRDATIELTYTDIYDETVQVNLGISVDE